MKSTSSYITENVKVVATAAFDEEYTELSDSELSILIIPIY